ncbi:FAD-dependent oxidoreductase [Lottiidibacillus patelloidae]|uniref:FAD-dependent oxidoreductase n=1 Tax=Lottiidibacillus patelloidae TaxID=2670334 RepID=A0A263BWD9_9BACI|nr:FAD-dependent oxidoreductase [Lottiidibacillus patelloidae]OZM58025.1 FAD-dependent oxidoreductase [Lottiidibacillus patelloidae]
MKEENAQAEQLPKSPISYWIEGTDIPTFNQLQENIHADVVIVGGGITGITTAYLLMKEGKKVALIEADQLLNGTTGHTTAKITAQHDLIYDEYITHFGVNKARLYYEANMEALQFIKDTVQEQNIDCEFETEDAFLYATTEEYASKLEKEYEAYQKLHIDGQLVDQIPFNIKITKGLSMKGQAQFHPLKYLAHLIQLMKEEGCLLFEKTVAVNIEENGEDVSVLTRDGYSITAKHIVSSSHFPFYEGTGLYSTRMYAERSYILAVKTKDEYPGGMYLSVDQPTRSLRSVTINGEKMVLVGGDSHKSGQGKDTLEHYNALKTFAQQTLASEEVVYRWSAQDLITIDKLPYVGAITPSKPNILIATGYRKWGMTNGTAAARLLTDLIMEKDNPYQDVYSPSRFYADPSLKHFFKENVDVVKHLIKGKLEVPVKEVHELENDEGAAVLIDGHRKGAYKDKEGNVHIVDTTCTHLGCEVNWNHGERSWDCPCHGSRFSYNGEVMEGPAEKPLQKYDYKILDNLTSEDSGY